MKKLILALLLASASATPTTHGVLMKWANPTGVTIQANTLYCGPSTGLYTMNWILPASSQYDWLTTDTTNPPTAGKVYFCAVTDTVGGIESGYSNEVSFTFPTVPPPPTGMTATTH